MKNAFETSITPHSPADDLMCRSSTGPLDNGVKARRFELPNDQRSHIYPFHHDVFEGSAQLPFHQPRDRQMMAREGVEEIAP